MSSKRSTPRSKIDEIKALRGLSRQTKTNIRNRGLLLGSTLTTTLNSIVTNSDITPSNNSLVITKPSVPLLPLSKLITYRSLRERRGNPGLNLTNASLNSSLTSNSTVLNSSQRSVRIPRPPSKPREEELQKTKIDPQIEFSSLQKPISAGTALKLFRESLTNYEQSEILEYKEIYYLGFKSSKSGTSQGPNYGFDDEKGNFKLYKGDHIAYRYEILQLLGKGSFGQVCKCFDHKAKQNVAIKLVKSKKRFRHQAAVEVKVLDTLKKYDPDNANNVIRAEDHFIFRKHTCLVFELLSSSLYDLLKSNNFEGLSLSLIRRFAIQIFFSLKFIQKLNIIHCDLKPENILLKQANKSGLKVIDFGSSCFESEKVYTYIQSRFYRAPEIILGIPYSYSIDMWSAGCILAELFTGNALFPGESEAEQLQYIMEIRGVPPEDVLAMATRRKVFFNSSGSPRLVPNSKGKIHKPAAKDIRDEIKTDDALFLDLIIKCLEWDPGKRITPDEALSHEWILEGIPKPPTSRPTTSRPFLNKTLRGLAVNKNHNYKLSN
ncbi:DYRK4_11 [Blepharisma stoltei]|uniref:dual-specificity kinase n=1 Tax=Blepharisma stoltei TaxID=1481888 RepID=A0AAU9K2W1_9CILI|nr:unnamed protein product [Blepharisma stoltei]